MRKGTLTDAQTLGMYEDGVSIIALCVHEGMTCYGVISRLGRARRERRDTLVKAGRPNAARMRRTKGPQPTFDSFDALRAAVRDLERHTRQLSNA